VNLEVRKCRAPEPAFCPYVLGELMSCLYDAFAGQGYPPGIASTMAALAINDLTKAVVLVM